jgi:hypothetical protein
MLPFLHSCKCDAITVVVAKASHHLVLLLPCEPVKSQIAAAVGVDAADDSYWHMVLHMWIGRSRTVHHLLAVSMAECAGHTSGR